MLCNYIGVAKRALFKLHSNPYMFRFLFLIFTVYLHCCGSLVFFLFGTCVAMERMPLFIPLILYFHIFMSFVIDENSQIRKFQIKIKNKEMCFIWIHYSYPDIISAVIQNALLLNYVSIVQEHFFLANRYLYIFLFLHLWLTNLWKGYSKYQKK